LRDKVGLAGLEDQLRNVTHGFVHRELPELDQDYQPEEKTQSTYSQAYLKQCPGIHALDADLTQVGKF
jgi:hypothetical protein